ncbi:MAG TPA: hypothetical protein VFW03_24410 [Gemmatimonadaceae bacterium]|nr:hypothetical protein [Gemmatimonadaceae bacterium]
MLIPETAGPTDEGAFGCIGITRIRPDRSAAAPIAKAVVNLLMPFPHRTFLTPERMFGWGHAYRIDWDRAVTA